MSVSMKLCNFSLSENRDEKWPSLYIIASSKQKRNREMSKNVWEREREWDNIKTKKQSKLVLCATVGYFMASRSFVAGSHPIQFGVCVVLVCCCYSSGRRFYCAFFLWTSCCSFFFFFFFFSTLRLLPAHHSLIRSRPFPILSLSNTCNYLSAHKTFFFLLFCFFFYCVVCFWPQSITWPTDRPNNQPIGRPPVCLPFHSTTSYLLTYISVKLFELRPKYFLYFQSQSNLIWWCW